MSEHERVQFKLMIPADLKAALEQTAHENRRSLSAEIIHRLSATIEAEATPKPKTESVPAALIDDAEAIRFLKHLDEKYDAMRAELQAMSERYEAETREFWKRWKAASPEKPTLDHDKNR